MTISREIKQQEILDQVDRICRHVELHSKKRLCRFLRYIVDETLNGRGQELKGYSIALGVFDRDKEFDPDNDPIVRIEAGRLRRSLEIYYLTDGRDDPVQIVIPKGGYLPKFLPAGELPTRSDQEKINKTADDIITASGPSIAVLPFRNLTDDPAKEYIAQGFTEELAIELTRYEDLTVIGCRLTTQSEKLLRDNQNLSNILSAHFLLEGGVKFDSQQVIVLIKLIDTITNEQVWAERYRYDLSANNLVKIQEEIAHETARLLGSEYGIILQRLSLESQRRKPKELETYEAILRFYYYEIHHTNDLAVEAFQALEQALEKDPDCGVTTAMLASLYGTAYMLDTPNNTGSLEKMSELAEKALKLDPNSQTVRIIYASKLFACNEKERFFEEAEKCLTMNLNSPLRMGSIGFYLSLYGDWERGKSMLNKVMNHNIGFPLFFYGATTLFYYRKGEYYNALLEANKYNVPPLFWGPMLRATVLGQLNKEKDARAEIQHLKSLRPDFETKAHYLISRYIKEESLVNDVMDGLQKAGLKLPQM